MAYPLLNGDLMDRTIRLEIAGLGIIFYSPKFVEHIADGEDYLESNYTCDEQVQPHIQKGTIVGFGTGSAGTFTLRFHEGYPTAGFVAAAEYKLRLGVECAGGELHFRDLYDLMDWESDCPRDQVLSIDDGVYHVTLCSNLPPSGYIGDSQEIDVYLQPLDELPVLVHDGVPMLYT